MIYFIEGKLDEILDDRAILNASGVGYEVWIPEPTASRLHTSLQKTVKLYTYHHIREDAQQLFGFFTLEDKAVFESLISVNGIGPKVALKTLSYLSTNQLIQALLTDDLAALTSVPGIGKKVAERLLIELKDKIQKLPITLPDVKLSTSAPNESISADLQLALKSLGYSQDEIKQALVKSSAKLTESTSLEEGIKLTLKHL